MNTSQFIKSAEGIFAYDTGAVDSGIRDECLRQELAEYLDSLDEFDQRVLLSKWMSSFLTDEALEQGYGWEDAGSLANWLQGGGLTSRKIHHYTPYQEAK